MRQLPILTYLAALAVTTIIMALIYVAVQQNYRMNANDPQVQLARDLADRLEHNRPTTSLEPADTVELSKSMAIFTAYYNANQQPVASTGYIEGAVPKLPVGVLDYAKNHNENWITWQPRKDIRLATVVKYITSSALAYVVVGRSLKEVEQREADLVKMIMICWMLCFAIIVGTFGWNYYKNKSLS